MSWVFLILAGLLEIVWAFAMKESQGFTRLVPSAVTIAALAGSLVFLALAMRDLPLGSAYMLWTGIGAVGAFAVGVWLLDEPFTMQRAAAALFIVAGMATMKLSH